MSGAAAEHNRPARSELIPYGHQWIDADDIASVVEVLQGDWLTQGPKIDLFEKTVAAYCGAKYAVAVSSGTAALHAACAIAGISNGDEVITTPITFAASANAVVYCGGTPVLADVREDTINIDPEQIKKKITSKTKAIIPVDFTGHPVELDEINAIARKHNLVTIEDACHALGAEYKGHRVGSLADMTILSFHPVKHITTGEGGMVLTDNQEYYEKLRVFRHHGITRKPEKGAWYYEIDTPGYNLRLTDIQCALGISQMNKLDRFIARRREIIARYNAAFAGIKELITPTESGDVKASYHLYVIQLRTEMLKVGRREIFDALRAENIGVQVHYIPVHYHPFYTRRFGYKHGDFPVAERYYERCLTLPLFPRMSHEDVEYVISTLQRVVASYRK